MTLILQLSLFNSPVTSKDKPSAAKMLKSWLSAVCYMALSFTVFDGFCAADEWNGKVDEIMGIVGQMTQIVSFNLINSTCQLNEDAVRDYVGSYLSAPIMTENDALWGWTTATFREIVGGINKKSQWRRMTKCRVTARDTLAAGISWIFDLVLTMHNPLWARVYETFGGDPYLVLLSWAQAALVLIQPVGGPGSPTPGSPRGTTLKAPTSRTCSTVPVGVQGVCGRELMTGMENYISVIVVPVIESTKLMTKLLWDNLGLTA
ncbi:Lysosomal beta glucosidase [Phytophthora citrophthora]|uniref:Lysosomal beta glucosidase n=1 Tax=Phytophthora citrophthora TaxID=4793 RepID=A0AAD9GZ97_9STRA|nr:Lysosomal beta glucosidase [Phytophthora citrophthora]